MIEQPPRTAEVCVKSDEALVTEREAAAGPWQADLAPVAVTAAHPIVDSYMRLRVYLIAARSGRSVSEGGRYSSASAAPRSDQESRSATVWPGLAFRWKAGMTPSR
jgi:hypothetical protein